MKRLTGMNRQELLQQLLEDMQAIRRRMGALPHKDAEITGSQWAVIRLLVHRESITVKDTADALGISSSAATQLIDPLVKKGYVTREEGKEDRRLVELRLSKKAAHEVQELRNKHNAQLSRLFDVLKDEELAQYVSLTKKLSEFSKKKDS